MVDEDGRVERKEHESAGPAVVAATLSTHPTGGVGIPFMWGVLRRRGPQAARRGAQGCRALSILECTEHGAAHKSRALARSGEAINLAHDLIVELYVHSHV